MVDIYQPVSSLVVVASKLKRKVPLCLIWDQADSLGDARGRLRILANWPRAGRGQEERKRRGRKTISSD